MTSEPTPLTAPTEPMHGCVRCGARIPTSESMCERCNPLGLKSPAASQAHGTALVGIVLFVVVMAVAGRLLIANVGPFRAAVSSVEADTAGLKVTISITNQGSSGGQHHLQDR